MFILSLPRLKYYNNTEGNMSIMLAVALGLMALVTAIAIDTTSMVSTKSKMQSSIDMATLFVSQNKESDSVIEDGRMMFRANFAALESVENLAIEFDILTDHVTGTAHAIKPLSFGGLTNKTSSGISTSTTVQFNALPEQRACILALNPTASPGILLNHGADVQSENCNAHVHSTQYPAMRINEGVTWELDETCVAGRRVVDRSGTNPSIETNCAAATDPFAGVIAEPDTSTCDFNTRVYSASRVTLTPGVYCGWHNFMNPAGRVEFDPGLYVIKNGGWVVDGGTWEGEGVTFYFADTSDIQFNAGVAADLSAPTSGEYKNVFITETPNLPQTQFVLNNSNGFFFEGIMYLPSRQVVFNNGAHTDLRSIELVAGSFIFNGASVYLDGVDGGAGIAQSATQFYISE